MAITVRELAGLPHLRIEVLGGEQGLDRVVTWAHSSDLDEPWTWLTGGELLMKNGRTFPTSEADQVTFLEGLSSARASALIIGADPALPDITSRALAKADELALALLKVPYSMSFIVLSRTVADALSNEEAARVARTERIYDTIHAAVAGDAPSIFLARLQAELRCELFVVDTETLRPLLDATPAPSPAIRNEIRERRGHAGGLVPGPLRFPLARRGEVIVVEVPYEEPTLLIASYTNRQPHDLTLLQHAAAAVAIEVAHGSLRADYQRQIGSELLTQLIDARLDPSVGNAQLMAHDIDPVNARIYAIEGTEPSDDRHLHVGLRRRDIPHLLLRRDGLLFVLLRDASIADDVAGATVGEFVRKRLVRHCTMGVSNPLLDASRGVEALREALWAIADATTSAPFMEYEHAAPLPALQNPGEAQALVTRVLGALIDYDDANGSDLLESLGAFFESQRSWQRCAERLNVHRQTVIYRMRRVEQLTNRSLSETGDLALLWLALSAYGVLRLRNGL